MSNPVVLNPVVITRPLAQAGVFAQQVADIGRVAVIFPLLEIHPLADETPLQLALQDVSDYAMVAFVSPNAIAATFAIRSDWPKDMVFAIMGEGSRHALAAHGVNAANATIISPRDPDRTDSQTLLQALDVAGLRGKKVLIMRGESGRELLADALRAAGVLVTQVAAYRRAASGLDINRARQLEKLLDGNNDWVVTSSEALRILMQMAESVGGSVSVAKMQQQKIFVPHVRIAETAQMLGLHNIILTGSGDARLLAALQSSL